MGEMGAIMVAELVHYTDDGMGLDEAIAAYLAACDVEGKSPSTVDAYAEALGMFHAICVQRVLREYVAYYNDTRPHQSLGDQPPSGPRVPALRDGTRGLANRPILGGLHDEYFWETA